ncbi:LytR/AlgR family response regulator transcription factor [Algoriphagus namhaensis]|uniref:LytR/AlgR family response regulator transcription factor n=1 Tax=Algoriphagus namhaensis TaxID=915353 RepID=A0ABV8AQ93_9BACT
MQILIIEDENPAAARLKRLIEPHFPGAQIHGNLDTVKSSMDWLRTNPAPDLIFCDIQLADGISFEIFKEIPVSSPVIFTTAFDQYAIQAFKVNSVDYLLKPLDPEAVEQAINKFKSTRSQTELDLSQIQALLAPPPKAYKSRFLVKFGEKIQSIPVEDVAFFFSESKVTYLQTHGGKRFILDSTMEQTEGMVDPKLFFRLNRKFLATITSISDIITYSNSRLKVILTNCQNQDILISRDKVADFKDWLDQ